MEALKGVTKRLQTELYSFILNPVLEGMIRRPERLSSPFFLSIMRYAPQWIGSLYDGWVIGTNQTYEAPLSLSLERILNKPETILDIATGTGMAALMLAEKFPEAAVTGLDHSSTMLKIAREKAWLANIPNVSFQRGDARCLTFDSGTFDLVVSSNAPVYLEETVRVLKPEETILVAFSMGGEAFVRNRQALRVLAEGHGLTLEALVKVGAGVYIIGQGKN